MTYVGNGIGTNWIYVIKKNRSGFVLDIATLHQKEDW
jgi:hypothetical protein